MTSDRESQPPNDSQAETAYRRLAEVRSYADDLTRQLSEIRRMARHTAREAFAAGVPVRVVARRLGVAEAAVPHWMGVAAGALRMERWETLAGSRFRV